jgi:RimJ/RimL family protein N-acetyltransferase
VRHEYRLEGPAFRLRPVHTGDATFIVGLRTDRKRSRFLNATSPLVQDHLAWTETYFQRPGDYYFIVERRSTSAPEGAIALYHESSAGEAEWGRWILQPGSLAAAESALLIYRFAFDVRALARVYCRTLRENQSVIAFHASTGLSTVERPPREPFVEQELRVEQWPAAAGRLTPRAERTAALLARSEKLECSSTT